MVLKTLPHIVVGSETFAGSIIVVVHFPSLPSVAFYAEMIVAPQGKVALSGTALKQTLCQSDACWYVVAQHLLYGEVFVLFYVYLIARIPAHLLGKYRADAYQ